MDDMSFPGLFHQPKSITAGALQSPLNPLPLKTSQCCLATSNCIKLSWCVFFLVTITVNVFAQETLDLYLPMSSQVLRSESLRYRMLSGVTEVGQITVNIINDHNDGLLQIVESTSGIFERTTTLLIRSDSTLSPLASHTVMTKESFSQEIQLQYATDKVSGAVLQPKGFGGTHEISTPLTTQTQDYYIVPYFLRSCALQVNKVIKFSVYEAVRNRVELARGWVVKLEEIEVPMGKFVCYRVEGFTGKLRWILYFDKEFPYRLIKQKLPALRIETELVEVTPNT